MPSVPRVVVVDTTRDVARIVHGALALLNRQYILVEVPTPDDALEEVMRTRIDLVVTAYRLSGTMHGIDLATRITHESLGTPVIVLADDGDPRVDHLALHDVPFQYYVRPVAEPFLRGLRIALDGEVAVVEEQRAMTPDTDLGPVPAIDVAELRSIILPLMRDVGAMGVILADRTGRVLVDEGATGYIDREKLAVILGPSFARSADISPLVGGNAWTMHYYDGERLDVFGLALGMHYFMCLIFEGSNRGAFGAVTMFGRRAADQMIDMLGEAAFMVPKPEPLPPPKEEVIPQAVPSEPVLDRKPPRKRQVTASEDVPEEAVVPEAAFDMDALFGQSVDEALVDSLFDPDKLEGLAASLAAEEDQRVGYDEAVDMGILDE